MVCRIHVTALESKEDKSVQEMELGYVFLGTNCAALGAREIKET
jgi:hypothetical protein